MNEQREIKQPRRVEPKRKPPEVSCKCGATTYNNHLARVAAGYTAHAYRGPFADSWKQEQR